MSGEIIAKHAFGRIELLSMPLEELKRRTTFRGVNNFVRKNIAVAFKRRMLIMKA